jgi:hypothetical protein
LGEQRGRRGQQIAAQGAVLLGQQVPPQVLAMMASQGKAMFEWLLAKKSWPNKQAAENLEAHQRNHTRSSNRMFSSSLQFRK